MERIAFKEWTVVCEALGRGLQSVILRKGGIAEGRDGFTFRHREFFLFPTFFHEQIEKTRLNDVVLPKEHPGEIELLFLAKVEVAKWITSASMMELLEPLHVLKSEVVRERFQYDSVPGVHVAFVRIFKLEPKWILPDSRSFGGCRSWVKLPAPPSELILQPILTEAVHENKRAEFFELTKAVAAQSLESEAVA